MLGYCGINCTECSACKATVASDAELMRKVQETFGDGKGAVTDWVCLGCLPPDPGLTAKYCTNCAIRECAIGRGVANCAVCPQCETCVKLRSFLEDEDSALVVRMGWLRDAFLARTRTAE